MAGSTQVSKPMSVKEIYAKAVDFEFNPFIALKYWIRTADTLLREAHIYEHEDNDQQAYLLLMRYATLVSERLPSHPSANLPENKKALRLLQKGLPAILERLEVLKPRISKRYDEWERALERRGALNAAFESEKSWLPSRSRMEFAASDPAVAGNRQTLAADENSELAVKLAHKEIRRRDAARKATRQAGVSEEEEQERRTAGLWDDWEAALEKKDSAILQDEDEMRRNMEASKRQMDGTHNVVPDGARKRSTKPPSRPPRSEQQRNGHSEYRYPSISKSRPVGYSEDGSTESRHRSISPNGYHLPPKPPKERV
ncbi:AMSH-like protease sst2, partial [Lachnellula suecica]